MLSYCPFCHHNDSHIYRSDQKMRYEGICDVLMCSECKCLFPRFRMDEEEGMEYLLKHYNLRKKSSEFVDPRKSLRQYQNKLQVIRRLFTMGEELYVSNILKKVPRGNSLDLGAFTGSDVFLYETLKFNAYGLEPYIPACEFAQKSGIKCLNGIMPVNIPEELLKIKFHLITMSEMIYYLVDLKESLRKARSMLVPEGHVFIRCHQGFSSYYNKASLFTRYGDYVQGIPTIESLRYWLGKTGFEIIHISGRARNKTFVNLPSQRISNLMNSFFNKIYNDIFLDLNKADRIYVLAKKI